MASLLRRSIPLARRAVPVTYTAARSLCSEAATLQRPQLVNELERLEKLPFLQSTLLRLAGTFSNEQWQAAAGGDAYVCIVEQSRAMRPLLLEHGALPDRYYTRLQVLGLHSWLVHVRLRDIEPNESHAMLKTEMMEKVWEQCALDLTRDFGFGFVEMSKHQKAAQYSWHGMCKRLDEALSDPSPREAMCDVLLRNLYVDEEGAMLVDDAGETPPEVREGALWLTDYLRAQRVQLASLDSAEILKGRLSWEPTSR